MLGPASSRPPGPDAAAAGTLPTGFVETVAFSGLTNPTVVRFANDGRVFVAEKSGLIKVFDNLADTSPTVFADLRTNVFNFWDRGLLGMALAPNFPTDPYIYVLYTYDHELGSSSPPPRWNDTCPTPPGPNSDGCVVSGRLSRLQASGNVMTGAEQVLIEDWCQQYPSHSIGTVEFGPDGALYAGAGDGASFTFADYGQAGNPLNPCGDPPGGVGATLTPPAAEGGSLRSQDVRTTSDPTTLDGSVIRVDPATGTGATGNPFSGSADANARRIIAYGLRNPFRFAFRPGTNEIWIGDVGWGDYEEINRILDATDSVAENFGWPCYEGNPRQGSFDAANLTLCESLYSTPSADTKPYFAYRHDSQVVAGESCGTGSSSVAGISFEFAPAGGNFPAEYQGALFFADYSRDCIWVMKKNGNPIPSPGSISTFIADAANPVNIEFGPQGDLFYADFDGGTIRRVHFGVTNPPPPSTGTHDLSDLAWTSQINTNTPVVLDRSRDNNTLTLNGTTFAKGLGTHAVSELTYYLGGVCSRFTASVGVDDEVGPDGSVVFQVYADTAKVYDSGVMTGASPTAVVDVSVAGASQLRIVVTDGGNGIDSDHGDWALPQVQCGGSDTTPPYVAAVAPPNGTTTALPTASPTATFSEAMDVSTISAATFTLVKQGTSAPLAVTVSYDAPSRTATLDPSVDLEASASYTATVTSGAKDLAGLPLTTDYTWSFTTLAGPNQAPTPTIDTPSAALHWKVGDLISFSGHATDPEQGTLAASSLSWTLLMQHCPSNCHTHTLQTWTGVAAGSFSAPDHEYPSHLELRLTATDAGGLTSTTSVALDPVTVDLTFLSVPTGLQLTVGTSSSTAPFTRTVIVGSTNSVSATTPQVLGGTTYEFSSWSDGGPQTHNIVAGETAVTYTATYSSSVSPPTNTALPTITGRTRVDSTLTASEGAWTGSQPMTFSYEWLLCTTNSLSSCTVIPGATQQTYVLTPGDAGNRLRVRVTATNVAGTASATSNSSGRIR